MTFSLDKICCTLLLRGTVNILLDIIKSDQYNIGVTALVPLPPEIGSSRPRPFDISYLLVLKKKVDGHFRVLTNRIKGTCP